MRVTPQGLTMVGRRVGSSPASTLPEGASTDSFRSQQSVLMCWVSQGPKDKVPLGAAAAGDSEHEGLGTQGHRIRVFKGS